MFQRRECQAVSWGNSLASESDAPQRNGRSDELEGSCRARVSTMRLWRSWGLHVVLAVARVFAGSASCLALPLFAVACDRWHRNCGHL
eukprot:992361-Amphidinium_carterae.1